ncbi:RDD family protein [Candidatus Peregrinibacteria bacterium]|nr:RDD family protein [Candidatus Peregrinibacteria bacterium]
MTAEIRVSTNNFQYAKWYKRVGALVVDMLIVNLILLLILPGSVRLFYLLSAGNFAELPGYFMTLDGIMFWVFPMLYLIVMQGLISRTFGMMLMKTKVADANGKSISWFVAIFRTFAYMLSGIILGLGFLPILFTPKKQGLHDKLTKTFVIMKK